MSKNDTCKFKIAPLQGRKVSSFLFSPCTIWVVIVVVEDQAVKIKATSYWWQAIYHIVHKHLVVDIYCFQLSTTTNNT
jgi:hypothetical protein